MKPTLTEADRTATVALACDMSKEHAGRAVDAALNAITHALVPGEEVRIMRFGTFSTRIRPQRPARHPQTGQWVTVPQARVVHFVPGSLLRAAVRQR